MQDHKISSVTILYISVFFICLTLTAFFAETFYNLLVFAVLCVLYIGSSAMMVMNKQSDVSKRSILISLAVACWLLVAFSLTPFSINQPQSIYRWAQLSMAGLTFLFFLYHGSDAGKSSDLFLILSTVPSISLLLWNIIYLIVPSLKQSIPSTTMLTFIHGHNHAFLYYLYVLLISIYFLNQKKYTRLFLILAITGSLGTILSFSRIGIFFLAAVLLGALRFSQLKNKLLKIFSALMLVYGALFFILSLNPNLTSLDNCIFPVLKLQLCKNFASETRGEYIKQALQAISERPFFGHGGGTFSITSLRYRDSVDAYSSMPHNEYLQLIYEFGLLGWIAVLGVISCLVLLIKSSRVALKKQRILIAILCMFAFDALFNYKTSFSFMLLLFAMVSGLTAHNERGSRHQYLKQYKLTYLFIVLLLALPVLLVSTRYIAAEVLYKRNTSAYVKTFPLNEYQVKKAITDIQTSTEDVRWIQQLYRNNAEIYKLTAQRLQLNQENTLSYLLELDPFNHELRIQYLLSAIERHQPQVVVEQARLLLTTYLRDDPSKMYQISPTYLEKMITYANSLAREDVETAKQITIFAYQFEPWRASTVNSIFLINTQSFSSADIKEILHTVNDYKLWGYWYAHETLLALKAHNLEHALQKSTRTIEINDSLIWLLWDQSRDFYMNQLHIATQNSDDHQRSILFEEWRSYADFLRQYAQTVEQKDSWKRQFEEITFGFELQSPQ